MPKERFQRRSKASKSYWERKDKAGAGKWMQSPREFLVSLGFFLCLTFREMRMVDPGLVHTNTGLHDFGNSQKRQRSLKKVKRNRDQETAGDVAIFRLLEAL